MFSAMIERSETFQPTLAIVAACGLCALAAATGMLGWLTFGPEMLLSLAENGLTFCL